MVARALADSNARRVGACAAVAFLTLISPLLPAAEPGRAGATDPRRAGAAEPGPAAFEPFQSALWKDPDGNPLPFQSAERIIEFMRDADIVSTTDIPIGVTNPQQVILERDGVRMRAALRDYEEVFSGVRMEGHFYSRLRDSFTFDVPAYEMARLLGLDNIPPVIFRRVGDRRVTLQIWLEGGLMEMGRVAQGLAPPSIQRYRQQIQNMKVFDSIIGNVDRHARNYMSDDSGDYWLIDHSRSFLRTADEMPYLDGITMCGRQLFERIRALDREELLPALSPPLTESEVDWVLRRRDKVVAHIENLIETRGSEGAVLFDANR